MELPLYVALPLAILAGPSLFLYSLCLSVIILLAPPCACLYIRASTTPQHSNTPTGAGCLTAPLVLGFPDLARWAARRAAPRRALLLAFPPAATAAAALGILTTGGLARGFSTPDSTPPGPLRFESPPYMALLGGVILALATLHTALAFYLVPAGHALLDAVGQARPPLRKGLRSALWAGSAFLLGALALAVWAPRALLAGYVFVFGCVCQCVCCGAIWDLGRKGEGSRACGSIDRSLSWLVSLCPTTTHTTHSYAFLSPTALDAAAAATNSTHPLSPLVSYHGWSLASGLLGGAIAGVLISDYHLLRRKYLPSAALYPTRGSSPGGNSSGMNPAALLSLLAAFLPFAFRAAVLRALGGQAWWVFFGCLFFT